jgi:hypothetical protein
MKSLKYILFICFITLALAEIISRLLVVEKEVNFCWANHGGMCFLSDMMIVPFQKKTVPGLPIGCTIHSLAGLTAFGRAATVCIIPTTRDIAAAGRPGSGKFRGLPTMI